jgi:CheY-like chemotaxis protein/sRNA-binding carbon storage regulator CsrA
VAPEYRLTVTVFDIQGERAQLGISAHLEVNVYRGEVSPPVYVPDVHEDVAQVSTSEDALVSLRVLIADPDEYLLDNYRGYLEQHGFEVATAKTGMECVERLREWSPDVLVLEPSIPWGSGDGVLAMMHEETDIPLVPVIVLTYGRDRSVLYQLAPFKIDDYQTKPLRPTRLIERIRTLAQQRHETHAVDARRISGG